MIYVEFFSLEGSPPAEKSTGWIGWDGGQFVLSDPNSLFLQNILQTNVVDRASRERVTTQEPERWLSLLCTKYKSPYLTASPAQEMQSTQPPSS